MKSLIKIKPNIETLYDEAVNAFDDGNLLFALKKINEARRADPFDEDFNLLSCEIYTELGLYDQALDVCMPILAMGQAFDLSCYTVCIRCGKLFERKGDMVAARYYQTMLDELVPDLSEAVPSIKTFIQSYKPTPDMIEEISELFTNTEFGFYMISAEDDERRKVEEAFFAMKFGDFGFAAGRLMSVNKESATYPSSRLLLAECFAMAGNEKIACGMMDTLMEMTDLPIVLASAAHIFYLCNKPKRAAEICEKIKLTGQKRGCYESFAIGRTKLENGKYQEALDCFDACLTVEPYNSMFLLYRASALSRLGRTGESSDTLLMMLDLDPFDTLAMYHNEQLQDGQPLSLTPMILPPEEILERLDIVCRLASEERAVFLKNCKKHYNVAIIRWAVLHNLLPQKDVFDITFALTEAPECELLFRQIVAQRHVLSEVRNQLAAVLIFSWKPDVCVCEGNVLRKIDCRLPTKIKSNEFLLRAWSWSIATLAQCAKNYEKPLRSMFARLVSHTEISWEDYTDRKLAAAMSGALYIKAQAGELPETEFFSVEKIGVGLCENAQEFADIINDVVPKLAKLGVMSKA